jgi:tetratricopeptide (TPR) repeat protein
MVEGTPPGGDPGNERPPSAEVQNVIQGNTSGPVVQARDIGSVRIEELHFHVPESRDAVPRDLPRAPLRFVNRGQELAMLDRLLQPREGTVGAQVAVVRGMHGVGKSAIGSFWAHRCRTMFEDGDLFGDFSKRRHGGAVDVGEVLGDFLRDLGTADAAVPPTLAARQKLFGRLTADKKLLVLLDDVDQPAQVKAVLPSGPGSVVVVTTNFGLEELLYDGADLIELEPLDDDTARDLLIGMVGVERASAESMAMDDLIRTCAGLPIALCVCGGRLASHPTRSISWLAEQVTREGRSLQALSGPGAYAVEGVFDFAYSDLPLPTARIYRRLGLHPGRDITAPAVAALADVGLAEATEALEVLHDAHLVEMPTSDRFRLHDLIRDHTLACAVRDEPEPDREESLGRLVGWYCDAVRVADRSIVLDRLRLSDLIQLKSQNLPVFATPADSFGWFGGERSNVLSVQRAAYDREWDKQVWLIAEALWPLCASHRLFAEWIESQQLGIAAGLRLGDAAVEARMRSQLARAYAEFGDFQAAEDEMSRAISAAEVSRNDMLKASVTEFGGVCRLRQGDAERALEAFRAARPMFETGGNARGAALQDYYIGWALTSLGEYGAALETLGLARAELAAVGDEISVGRVLVRRGEALRGLGRYDEAAVELAAALDAMSRLDIPFEQAEALETLASVVESRGNADVARAHRQQAYRIYKSLGHPHADDLLSLITRGLTA